MLIVSINHYHHLHSLGLLACASCKFILVKLVLPTFGWPAKRQHIYSPLIRSCFY